MPDVQAFSKHAYRRVAPSRLRFDREQSLMLPRLNAGGMRGALAEIQKPPNFVAKLR
jgi:hypothetical protein